MSRVTDLQKELAAAEEAVRQIKEQMKETKRLKLEKKKELETLNVEFMMAGYEYGESSRHIKNELDRLYADLSVARKEAEIAIRRQNQSASHRRGNGEIVRNVKTKADTREKLRRQIGRLHMELKQVREKMKATQAEIQAQQKIASPIYQELKAQCFLLEKQFNSARRRCSELRRQIAKRNAELQPGQ